MSDTALLMIDMQNSYLADDGVRVALGWPPIWRLDETIAACAELLTAARAQHAGDLLPFRDKRSWAARGQSPARPPSCPPRRPPSLGAAGARRVEAADHRGPRAEARRCRAGQDAGKLL